jgi:hypothetical protein
MLKRAPKSSARKRENRRSRGRGRGGTRLVGCDALADQHVEDLGLQVGDEARRGAGAVVASPSVRT